MSLFSDPQKVNAELSGGKAEAMFMNTYVGFINLPSARAGFAHLFRELADAHNLPALFHCTTGKDRTGWAAAALLTLCGVSYEDVLRDYLLSNDFILPEYGSIIQQTIARGIDQEIMLSLLGVRREYLESAFKEMQRQFGEIEAYFAEGLGINQAGQQAIRAQLVAHT
jgi:protein-tyrosine phosphatase